MGRYGEEYLGKPGDKWLMGNGGWEQRGLEKCSFLGLGPVPLACGRGCDISGFFPQHTWVWRGD